MGPRVDYSNLISVCKVKRTLSAGIGSNSEPVHCPKTRSHSKEEYQCNSLTRVLKTKGWGIRMHSCPGAWMYTDKKSLRKWCRISAAFLRSCSLVMSPEVCSLGKLGSASIFLGMNRELHQSNQWAASPSMLLSDRASCERRTYHAPIISTFQGRTRAIVTPLQRNDKPWTACWVETSKCFWLHAVESVLSELFAYE